MIINDDVGVGALLLHLTNTHCSKFMFVRFDSQTNQHLQLCTARTALSDSVIRSAKIG